MIRVLIADDQRLVRAGLRALCEPQPDIEVVGEAENGHQAAKLTERLLPHVVLMDLRMPGVDGIAATTRILAARPRTRVVALTTFDDDDHVIPALAAGMCGFLVKDAAPSDLLDGIRAAARGHDPFSPDVLRRLVGRAVAAQPVGIEESVRTVDLTDREREVLTLVADGMSNSEIAERLHLGLTTVKTHVRSVLLKTDSSNRAQLAAYAVRAGLAG